MSAPVDFSARIQLIVDVLAQSVDRAVLLDDEELTPITHSRQLGELDDVRVYSVLQRETRAEVKAALFDHGIGTASAALWTPAFPEHGLMPRFCVPVRSAAERFGYLWILDPEATLSEAGQRLAVTAGADLLAVLDRRNAAMRAQESAQYELLSRLLAADTPERAERTLRELQARNLVQPDAQVGVFVFEPHDKADPVDRSMALRFRLSATDRSATWFTMTGPPMTVLAVTAPASQDPTVADSVVNAVAAVYGASPAIGSSGQRLPITQAALAFRQAKLALTLAQIRATGAQVSSWSELGSWKTLALLAEAYGTAELGGLVHPGVIGLIEQGRDDLIHTLDVYLANGGDARRTAEELHLHRSSLYYRLEKLTEAIGGDLGDGEIRFELMLSLRLAHFAKLYRSRAPEPIRPTGV
ncbi:PucR family transcriptional regulator [Mycolicibacterium sp.]|uniref:PucR family transcriptional regulator n=1 Tax=Mycolicibacterium sp. TaxID=2320850 RepID=UPI0037C954F7